MSTVAGSSIGLQNGVCKNSKFNSPSGVLVFSDGVILVADSSNNAIRKIAADHHSVELLTGSVLFTHLFLIRCRVTDFKMET